MLRSAGSNFFRVFSFSVEEGGREDAEEDIEEKVEDTGEEDMEEVSSLSSKMSEERSIGGRTAVHEDMQHGGEM